MKLRYASLALLFVGAALHAQPGGPQRQISPAPGAMPISGDSLPPYIRQTPPTDAVIARIWEEGTQRSQVATLAQALIDSIGARLTASPEIESASRWAMSMYQKWGIPARQHRYGTWPSWQRGYTHVDLVAPRVRTLEAITLAWSPGTGGKAVTGDLVTLPDSGGADAYARWLRSVRGKFVLASPPQLSCRSRDQWAEYGTPESQERIRAQQDSVNVIWRSRIAGADSLQDRLRAAGAAGVITHGFSGYPGIDKVFGSPRLRVLGIDITCEDYGLLARLAERRQSPRLRVDAVTEMRGERPVYPGEKPSLTAPERILVLVTVVAVVIFEVWFFFFSGSPFDQRSGRGQTPMQPPAIAGRITTVSPDATPVCRPCWTRTSSSFT